MMSPISSTCRPSRIEFAVSIGRRADYNWLQTLFVPTGPARGMRPSYGIRLLPGLGIRCGAGNQSDGFECHPSDRRDQKRRGHTTLISVAPPALRFVRSQRMPVAERLYYADSFLKAFSAAVSD